MPGSACIGVRRGDDDEPFELRERGLGHVIPLRPTCSALRTLMISGPLSRAPRSGPLLSDTRPMTDGLRESSGTMRLATRAPAVQRPGSRMLRLWILFTDIH